MIYASDFRKGITFEINGEPHVVLDFQHVKPGKRQEKKLLTLMTSSLRLTLRQR
mgnify:CR=1 FL=1